MQAFAEKPKGKALDDWMVDTTVLGVPSCFVYATQSLSSLCCYIEEDKSSQL